MRLIGLALFLLLAPLLAQAAEMFARLDAVVEELGSGEADFALVFQRMVEFVATCGERHGHADALIDGTLRALARIGMFYGFRIADPAARARLYQAYIAECRVIIAEMAERTRDLFAGFAEAVPASVDTPRAVARE